LQESYANIPKPGEPHVQIDILEYSSDQFVHIVAELTDQDDSGIAQIETFGLRIQADGMVTSGLELYDAGGVEGKQISLDFLSRIYADMEQDSTGVVQSVISKTQKLFVEVLWGDSWKYRPTYRIIQCKELEPKIGAKFIINDSSMTSEISQLIGKVFGAFDYARGIIVIGASGVLVSGINHAKGASPEVLAFVRYGALIIASKQLFSQIEAAEVSIFDALERSNSKLPYYATGAHNQHRILATKNRQIHILAVIGLLLQDSVSSITTDTLREVRIDPSSPFDIDLSIRILKPCLEDCLNRLNVTETLTKFTYQTSNAANQLRLIHNFKTVSNSLRYLGQLFGVDRKKVALTTSIKFIVWHRLALQVADRINVRKNGHHFQAIVDAIQSGVRFIAALRGFEAAIWSLLFFMLALWWFSRKKIQKTENFSFKFSEAFLSIDRLEQFLANKKVKKVYVETILHQDSMTKIEYEDTQCSRWKSSKVVVLLRLNTGTDAFLHTAKVRLTRDIETLQLSSESVRRMLIQDLESSGLKNHNNLQDIYRLAKEREKNAALRAAAQAEALFHEEQTEIERKIEEYKSAGSYEDTTKV
jgi:hypothetical protein